MIRLVTQFDRPTARPVYATPTCGCAGCCCCCSCCVGTAVATLSFAAMNVYFVAREEERPRRMRWLAAVLAGLALPVGVLAGYLAGGSAGAYIGAGAPTWFVLVASAYVLAGRTVGLGLRRAAAILAVAALPGLIELFAVAYTLDGAGFLFVELGFGAAGVVLAYFVARASTW